MMELEAKVKVLERNNEHLSNLLDARQNELFAAESEVARLKEALKDVPYAITMALQWTLVPSDVPEQQVAALGEHRKMLASVYDAAAAALSEEPR